MVRYKPPLPAIEGLYGKPTVVNNVISLATVPIIMDKGASFYANYGMGRSKGPLPIQLAGNLKQTGLIEKAFGISLRELLYDFGGGSATGKPIKAVQVGGASGICLSKDQFDRTLAYEDAATGGSIMIFNENRDMLKVLKNFMEFFVEESCGQCTPCRIGNVKLLEGVEMIEIGDYTFSYIKKLKELGNTMKVASKCGLGQSSPNTFISILENFSDEIFNNVNGGSHE